jgi:Protein of unknown function (DUF4007)
VVINASKFINYRFSGHETFPCRYTWLPKAVQSLARNPALFCNEDEAMVRLGVGKNMVRAIRFWTDAASVSEPSLDGTTVVSSFGADLLGKIGYDPFLEDVKSLWLIHWNIATNRQPLFAWDYLLNSWHRPDFTRTEGIQFLQDEVTRLGKKLSRATLENHFTTFLHTYVPTRSKKGEVLEDNLDCPLVELDLVMKVGERIVADSNRRESIYAFRTEDKPEISAELFVYCLNDFWIAKHPNESTLTFRDVCVGKGSPGQIFKLPEHAIRQRLESLENDARGCFSFQESAALQRVTRRTKASPVKLLKNIYR